MTEVLSLLDGAWGVRPVTQRVRAASVVPQPPPKVSAEKAPPGTEQNTNENNTTNN